MGQVKPTYRLRISLPDRDGCDCDACDLLRDMLTPDTRLQTIADAWNDPPLRDEGMNIGMLKLNIEFYWPELADAIGNALTGEETDDGT